jgi:hypothetical protein
MTRMARAFWILAVGMALVIFGQFLENALRRDLGLDLDVLRQGVPLVTLIGLTVFACGLVQVGLAAWRELR